MLSVEKVTKPIRKSFKGKTLRFSARKTSFLTSQGSLKCWLNQTRGLSPVMSFWHWRTDFKVLNIISLSHFFYKYLNQITSLRHSLPSLQFCHLTEVLDKQTFLKKSMKRNQSRMLLSFLNLSHFLKFAPFSTEKFSFSFWLKDQEKSTNTMKSSTTILLFNFVYVFPFSILLKCRSPNILT